MEQRVNIEKQTKNFVCVDCGRLFIYKLCYIIKNNVVREVCKKCFEARKKKSGNKEE